MDVNNKESNTMMPDDPVEGIIFAGGSCRLDLIEKANEIGHGVFVTSEVGVDALVNGHLSDNISIMTIPFNTRDGIEKTLNSICDSFGKGGPIYVDNIPMFIDPTADFHDVMNFMSDKRQSGSTTSMFFAFDVAESENDDAKQSVLQDYVMRLPLMQQSVLLSSIRGPDGMRKHHPAKHLARYMRRCILISAFDKVALLDPHAPGGGSFTGPLKKNMSLEDAKGQYFSAADELPMHYHTHFFHAAEIIGYHHPDDDVRTFWQGFYMDCVKHLHLAPETKEQMDRRLSDDPDFWKKGEIDCLK